MAVAELGHRSNLTHTTSIGGSNYQDDTTEPLKRTRQRSYPENALENKTRQGFKDYMDHKALVQVLLKLIS